MQIHAPVVARANTPLKSGVGGAASVPSSAREPAAVATKRHEGEPPRLRRIAGGGPDSAAQHAYAQVAELRFNTPSQVDTYA